MFRIAGSAGLIGIALFQLPLSFVVFYIVLGVSDLIDGPIARHFGSQSPRGATLDSIADVTLSCSLLLGVAILNWPAFSGEWVFLGIAIISYLVAVGFAYLKFRRFPSYHTVTAKLNHVLVALAGICLVLDWSVWPLRIAAMFTVVTNVESLLISTRLPEWQANVSSVFNLPRQNGEEQG